MTARSTLWGRLDGFRSALLEPVIVSMAPSETVHNSRARLFRNGLAVVGYAIIEDFLKTRMSEVLGRIGQGNPKFGDLPDGLRQAATLGVVDAMRFQEQFNDKRSTDYYTFLQEHARCIASTSGDSYQISAMAFGFAKSNLTVADVEAMLLSFGVESPWNALGSIASRAGVGVVAIKSAMSNAAARRHRAAHQAGADIETQDLISMTNDIIAISLGFDLLLSKALRRILDVDMEFLSGRRKLAASQVKMRFIENSSNKWREITEGAKRAHCIRESRLEAVSNVLPRARANGEAIVIRDVRGIPAEWSTPDVD